MNFLIKTLGCRVNQAESIEVAEKLLEKGWSKTLPPNLCILNTCVVTRKAEKETRQEARGLKRGFPNSFLVVTGCAVNYWKMKGIEKKMQRELKVDLLVENERKMEIPDLPILSRGFYSVNTRCWRIFKPRVFLEVQDGCNKFCSYCIVPYLRGRSKSKNPEEIIKEIKKLEKEGVKEVVLCGINLADYQPNLKLLLRKILKETRIPRIRLGPINLEVFYEGVSFLWSDSRLCPHFHIPLQSGCNETLKRMGRNYTFEEFKKVVDKILQVQKNANITTDLMVGFPGETSEEFEESFKNVKGFKLGKIHVFRYSKGEGTRAAEMEDKVPEKVKKERAKKVRELSKKMAEELAQKFIGKKLRVLFERKKDDYWEGLSENYIRVRTKEKGLRGMIKAVRIETVKGGVLYGRVKSHKGKL